MFSLKLTVRPPVPAERSIFIAVSGRLTKPHYVVISTRIGQESIPTFLRKP